MIYLPPQRFLHPAVVAPYRRIWLWDEDIEAPPSFDPAAYAEIAEREGLHISQPALGDGTYAWTRAYISISIMNMSDIWARSHGVALS